MNKTRDSKAQILVVIPTLGQRTDLLRKTLESIKSQNDVQFDIVMVYPLKNIETAELAKKYNAISVDDPGGLSSALNIGLKTAAKPHHRYISWIGDDDTLSQNSLKTTLNALETNPNSPVAFGYCDYIDQNDKRLFTSKAGNLAPWIMTWGPNLVPLPGILFRKSALDTVGPFDENNKYSMDLEMLLRLKKIGKFVNTKRTLASFRWHTTSTTVGNRNLVLKETEAVKRKFLPTYLLPFAVIWEVPVRIATKIAAKRVNRLS